MQGQEEQRLIRLLDQAAEEKDPLRLLELAAEINRLLEGNKGERLRWAA